MSRFSDAAGAADLDLASVNVRLVFELGRLDVPAGEVAQLAAGTVLPLARTVGEAVDIVANGKRIGVGTLVQVGDSIGVRVTRLTHDA